ncbi:MAG: phage tail protein [Myxococcota bacterium]
MTDPPILSHRFKVSFTRWINDGFPLETHFQSVSGLSATMDTTKLIEGGHNLHPWGLPDKLSNSPLTLTRGMVVGSFVNLQMTLALSSFRYMTTDVLVQVLDEQQRPAAAWFFYRAYPTKWSTGDLNAGSPGVVIDTIELQYTRMQVLKI